MSKRLSLYVDSDGHVASTYVIVLGEDGEYLGELGGVQRIAWSLDTKGGRADVEMRVARVPGRFMVDRDRATIDVVDLGPDEGAIPWWWIVLALAAVVLGPFLAWFLGGLTP